MSDFKEFVFKDPKENTTCTESSNDPVNEECDNKSRFSAYQSMKSPFATRSEIQEKRRLQALELQKRQRNDIVASLRNLDLLAKSGDDDEEEEEEEESNSSLKRRRDDSDEDMEEVCKMIKNNPQNPKKNKKKANIYANQIMYAEYLESIPSDFAQEWITIICPKGKRCFVMSGNGQTISRSRGGKILGRFQSTLPNGSRHYHGSEYCILDCVYDAVHWTFYVLDIMCWKGYSVADCDTSFRHFWLHTKFASNEFDAPNGENRFYKFVPLQGIPTTELTSIANNPEDYLSQNQGYTYDIDGLLFYHKQAHYIGGSTPLVCWVPRDKVSTLLLQH
ncbi:hypothetical protein CU097_001913 [Rhizopus azygosporus]|uniref:Snurportin-1 n=1 Tax=Rhizopus azygosporus TaxID=86630 RepID=A0A367IRE1_RHIAZ|nr:hypothetical protein CU097_001913 [Rhizopus azygosporus]